MTSGFDRDKILEDLNKKEDRNMLICIHAILKLACPQPCTHQTQMHNLWNVWIISNLRRTRRVSHTLPSVPRVQSWTTQPRLFMTNIDPLARVRRKNSAQTDNKNNCNYITTSCQRELISRYEPAWRLFLSAAGCSAACRRPRRRTLPWRCVSVGMCQDAADYRNKSV